MQTLFFFFTSLVASIVAVKLTSTALKAGKHDWLSCTISVVLSLIVLTTVGNLVAVELLALAASVLLVGFVLESILETTFKKGMVIAASAIVVQWVINFGFTKLGINTDMLLFFQKILASLN